MRQAERRTRLVIIISNIPTPGLHTHTWKELTSATASYAMPIIALFPKTDKVLISTHSGIILFLKDLGVRCASIDTPKLVHVCTDFIHKTFRMNSQQMVSVMLLSGKMHPLLTDWSF